MKNDFAFLLHMVDQYDQLYSKRFGVFLSEVSENKLREISLNHEWTFEKLRQHVTRNVQDKLELHLFMLSGVPDAVFDLTDLEVLKLELIPEARITAKISQMINLHELHFYHCPAKVEQTAFSFPPRSPPVPSCQVYGRRRDSHLGLHAEELERALLGGKLELRE